MPFSSGGDKEILVAVVVWCAATTRPDERRMAVEIARVPSDGYPYSDRPLQAAQVVDRGFGDFVRASPVPTFGHHVRRVALTAMLSRVPAHVHLEALNRRRQSRPRLYATADALLSEAEARSGAHKTTTERGAA
jgi:hypothetical protein